MSGAKTYNAPKEDGREMMSWVRKWIFAEYTTVLDTELEGWLVVHTSYPNDNVIMRNSTFTTPRLIGEKRPVYISLSFKEPLENRH